VAVGIAMSRTEDRGAYRSIHRCHHLLLARHARGASPSLTPSAANSSCAPLHVTATARLISQDRWSSGEELVGKRGRWRIINGRPRANCNSQSTGRMATS
jgi:hypothetical protein